MSGFECSCFNCHADFTADLPTVFCSGSCREAAAARCADALVKYLADHPEIPLPGDRVRLRTDEDRAFERDVKADLAAL